MAILENTFSDRVEKILVFFIIYYIVSFARNSSLTYKSMDLG